MRNRPMERPPRMARRAELSKGVGGGDPFLTEGTEVKLWLSAMCHALSGPDGNSQWYRLRKCIPVLSQGRISNHDVPTATLNQWAAAQGLPC